MSWGILVSIIFVGSMASAKGVDANTVFNKVQSNWVSSEDQKVSDKNATVTSRISQRLVYMRGNVIPVATMTSGEIVSKNGAGVPKDLAGHLAKLANITKWKKANRGTYTAYESYLPKTGEYLKLFVSNTNKKGVFKYSVATIRGAYMIPMYYEAELLQRKQMEGGKAVAELEKSGNVWTSLFQYFVSPAYADIFSSISSWLGSAGSSSGASSLTDTLNNSSSNISSAANTASNALNNASSAVNNVANTGNNIANAGNNLANAGNNIANTGNNIANSINGASSNASNIANQVTGEVKSIQGTIAGASADMKQVGGEINDTLKGFQNPVTMGKVALATGFGYTLGSMLAQFAATGAVDLAKNIFYEVTGQMNPAMKDQVLSKGKKAWDQLSKLSEQVAEVDMNVQVRLAALAEVTGKDPSAVLTDLDYKSGMMKRDLAKVTEALKNTDDPTTNKACMVAQKQMEDQLEVWKAVRKIVQQPQQRSKADICSGFDDLYQQWTNAELQMRNARNVLMRNMYAIIADNSDTAAASKEEEIGFQANRKKQNRCAENDLLDQATSQARGNDCDCSLNSSSPWTPVCASVCRQVVNYQAAVKSCQASLQADAAIDVNTENAELSDAVANSAKMLEESKVKLVKATCVAGSTKGLCDGKEGSFTKIRNTMQDQFNKVAAMCGTDSVISTSSPGDVAAGQKKAAEVLKAPEQPIADAPAADLPQASERGGFFSRIFSGMKANASNRSVSSVQDDLYSH